MTGLINSYYKNDKAVANDREIQAWLKETEAAQVYDFPKQIQTREDIIGILTHQAYLGSVVRMYSPTVLMLPISRVSGERCLPRAPIFLFTISSAEDRLVMFILSIAFADFDIFQRCHHERKRQPARHHDRSIHHSWMAIANTNREGRHHGHLYVFLCLSFNLPFGQFFCS